MTVPQLITKDRCRICLKFILMHNRIVSCESCNDIVHSECSRNNFEFNHLHNQWQCNVCILDSVDRYNPFSHLTFDKYDPVHLEESNDLAELSKIHMDCKYFDDTNDVKNIII